MTGTWNRISHKLHHYFYIAHSLQGNNRRTMCGRSAKAGIPLVPGLSRENKGHILPLPPNTCWTCYYAYCKENAKGEMV